jgi:hypothetical protein
MAVDIFSDGHDQLFEILEDAAPQTILGDVAEEAYVAARLPTAKHKQLAHQRVVCPATEGQSMLNGDRETLRHPYFTRGLRKSRKKKN